MKTMKTLTQNIKTIILLTAFLFTVNFVYAAWANPTADPTGGNAPAPINVSNVDQVKAGELSVKGTLWADGGLGVQNNAYFGGNVGIGTASPTGKLQVNGNLKLHSVTTTSLLGNIQMEDNLFQVSTPAGKTWEFRDNGGSIWFYDGTAWTQKAPSVSGGGGITTVYDYGTSKTGGTVRPAKMAYGVEVSLPSNNGASITGLPFSNTSSFSCVVSPNIGNGGGGGPFGGGPDPHTGFVGCYKYSGSHVWLWNTDDQPRVVNWIAIGY